ncbi:ABC transporter permease [Cryptosporangium phraense]|uniref:Transport permease protein n=1 Tax=Cryptosporangium phraense TaxID=2593070 RepID=A0A545B059_9ACTN|nr:ABC transporter permease [Cryptosporangium phraense]TQS46948.1 ABC transporter permease [Cryptosporangium phraense]
MSAYALSDSATMVRRSLTHVLRYPITVVVSVGVPVLMLLLFVGVFRALGQSLAAGQDYIDYIVPGVLLMTVAYGCQSTTMSVNQDKTEGIILRFRTMAISSSAVLTGHVVAAVARTLVSLALVLGVSVALGFRPQAGALGWLAAIGVLVLLVLALTWLAVATGLTAPTAEGTAGFTLLVQLLPFVSSAFVPTDTMSGGVRWFAANQPFSPIIEAIRGFLLGTPVGSDGWIAVGWCVGLTLVGYLWARSAFRKVPVR